ncbi:ribosomal protein L7/L12 [Nonomuraea sp. NPDC049152]|uniref:ribosomal protein L7/L12 n=1 Tax=Nonomuraea sp. NPDC049152 TaxID=3154350 RepID=UPI0033E4037D
MPNIGVAELLIILAVIAVIVLLAILIIGAAVRVSRRPATAPPMQPMMRPTAPHDLEGALRDLIAGGRQIQAIKLLRQHTGLGLKQAKDVVDAIAAGHGHPMFAGLRRPPAGARPDLATRVRELKSAGRTEQAVHLVIGETGMGQSEAEAFVQAL